MHKLNSKLVLAAALSAALLAGCGGGSSSSNADGSSGFGVFPVAATPGTPGTPPTPVPSVISDLGQNIASVFEYISRLIASNSENSDPVDINALTLATDETSSPTPLP